jgi:hypothetical protein
MKSILAITYVLTFLTLGSNAAFFNCQEKLASVKVDSEALSIITKAFTNKFKFASECLELIIQRNFYETGEFLINDYYTKTAIDTELIVKKAIQDVKRNQGALVFKIKKRQ